MIPFPDKKYNIIYADPSWKFNNKNTGGYMNSGADAKYKTMKVKDICNLPVPDICEENAILFMWWVGSQPKEAIQVCESWGFKLKNINGFVWVKKTKTWKDWFGMGFWTRAGSESILIATKGKIKRIDASIRQVVYHEGLRHSEKPDIFRKKIIKLVGNLPKIELFAREKFDGWDSWGDEINIVNKL
jgi:N6-adenosine-specific RNA methylase IME4